MTMTRIDTDGIRARVDLRAYVEQRIGPPVAGGNWKCPIHGEARGASFSVKGDRWRCFGKCDRGGDVIGLVMALDGVDFQEACARLGANPPLNPPPNSEGEGRADGPTAADAHPPDDSWQAQAWEAMIALWSNLWEKPSGKRALDYLTGRGLLKGVVWEADIGYLPGKPGGFSTVEGLLIPHGIVIPIVGLGYLWGLHVRTAAGENKYLSAKGSKFAGSLYNGDRIGADGLGVMIDEGEFNVLSVDQVAGDLVTPVGLLGAGQRVSRAWRERLLFAPAHHIRADEDEAGDKMWERARGVSARARRWEMPDGIKDPNEMLIKCGGAALRRWVEERLSDV